MKVKGIELGPTLLGLVGFLVVLAALGPFVSRFLLTILINLLIYACLAYSINLITGLTGYVSFGHVVFMGVGSYALGFAASAYGVSPLIGVVLGATSGLALAIGIGAVALRLRGVYFAIASLVTPLAADFIVIELQPLGGGQGLVLNLGFEPLAWFYTIWVFVAIEVALTHWIRQGRIGQGIRALRNDEDAALAVGVNAPRLKLLLYGLSGLFAGAAGAVYAWTVSGVFPGTAPGYAFSLTFSLLMLAMIVVGGMGTLLGPMLGAIAVYIPYFYFLNVFIGAQYLIIGALVVLIALFAPGGIVSALRRLDPYLEKAIE